MVSIKPKLVNLKCFGKDGRVALVNTFSAVFPKAWHLRYFLHFHQNVERRLHKLGVSSVVEFKKNIFGDPEYLQFALVDTFSKSELESKVCDFTEKARKMF